MLDGLRARVIRTRARIDVLLTPAETGLPRGPVVAWGIVLLGLLWSGLVATGINGTSSGAFFSMVYGGSDPALLAGVPNLVRSDEWNVQTVWAIAQLQQGLPAVSGSFPGGMDATIPQDLPRGDWSVVFRPHLWGFFFLNPGQAQAWKWWLPLFALAAALYVFCLVWFPRRPALAMVLSLGFVVSPFFQWWFLQTTLWPVAWGFAVLAGVVWMLRSRRKRGVVWWLVIIAYLTVVVGMGIYVPYILPVALVVAFAAAGIALGEAKETGWRWVLGRIVLLLGAALSAGAVLVIWLVTRWDTVAAFLSTAYPGERLAQTGGGATSNGFIALFGSSFTNILKYDGAYLGKNAPESATFFLPGLFLLPVIVWLCIRAVRSRARLPWTLLLTFAAICILLLFTFVPGWDGVAHLLLLDRTIAERARIGLGFGSMILLVLTMAATNRVGKPSHLVSLIGPVAFLVGQGAIAAVLWRRDPDLLSLAHWWWVIAFLSMLVIWAASRARVWLSSLSFLAVGVLTVMGVSPLYVGVFDLRQTAVSQGILSIDGAENGTWIGMGSNLTTALLLENGLRSYNGFQGAPSSDMWKQIDPSGRYSFEWNRLAGISWTNGEGEPVVFNPYPDQILVSFDACSAFAQEKVSFVLSDSTQRPDSPCLRELDSWTLNSTQITAWHVIPR